MQLVSLKSLDTSLKKYHFCGECGKAEEMLIRLGGRCITEYDGSIVGGDISWTCEACLFDAVQMIKPFKIQNTKFMREHLAKMLNYVKEKFREEKVKDFEEIIMFIEPFLVAVDSERNWVQDFKHENGNYNNKCIKCDLKFIGHKRRVTCFKCTHEEK